MTDAKLDDEIAGQVLRLDLAALFPPQPHQSRLVIAHDDPGVRAADEVAAVMARLFHSVVFMTSPFRKMPFDDGRGFMI